jgi:hypothetical protein
MYLNKPLSKFTQAFGSCLSTQLFEGKVNFTDFEHLFSKISVYENTRGKMATIQLLKDVRVTVYNYISGRKINTKGTATYKDGIPKVLGPRLSSLLRTRSPVYIRAILTALLYSRMIDEWKKPDTSTITNGPTFSAPIREDFKIRIPEVMQMLKIAPNQEPPIWVNPHYTTKNSPQGLAMHSLKEELLQIAETPKLYGSIQKVGGPRLKMYMEHFSKSPQCIKLCQPTKASKKGRLRSIGVVKDTEGKSRLIAMADYWSQTSLKPLHDQLLKILKGNRSDLTFGQDIKPFGDNSQLYWSFDLTAATDRLPIFLYEDILEHMYGKEYQSSWSDIMIGTDFNWKDSKINYSTGQPMGMYSSWALLALAHHAIVKYSAHKIGFKQFYDYRILGDDIVIRNDLVAHSYAETLKSLGVEISSTKTLVSKTTFEFAKRLFHEGNEVTGFPINGWISACESKWINQLNIVETAIRRGYSSTMLVNIETLVKLQEWTKKDYNLRYKLSRNILTHIAVTGSDDLLLFKVGRLWNCKLSCVTSLTSFRKQVLSEFGSQVQSQFIATMNETVKLIKLSLPDNKSVQSITNIRAMTGEVSDQVYMRWSVLNEPMVQAISSALHRSMQNFNDIEDKYSFMGMFPTLERFVDFIKEVDLRVPNINVRDRSRKSERALSVTASIAIKALMGSR